MKIEKGTKLIAIDPCEIEYEDGDLTVEKALIVGKEYTVLRIDEDRHEGICIVIQSEIDDSHYFPTAQLKDFFTFPENEYKFNLPITETTPDSYIGNPDNNSLYEI